MVWAVTHFKDVIYSYEIKVYINHKPLMGLFKDRLLTGRLARWKCTLQNYSPSFHYVQGKLNTPADALSRNALVAAVTPVPRTPSLGDPEEISRKQRDDDTWSRVIHHLESGDN